MSRMIHPVILSGGSGTRLWPMSRSHYPKQLLALVSDYSLLQEAALRVPRKAGFAAPLVIANEEHRFIIAEQLRGVDLTAQALLLDPVGRNTAPAATVAALRLVEADPDAMMLVMPPDPADEDDHACRAAAEGPDSAARGGRLVAFGIHPGRADAG